MKANLPLVISVTSGKGGVGKTNMSVNLACSLAKLGKRVLLLDADLGLANVDVLLGMMPQKNIFDLFQEGVTLKDVIIETPYGFSILPASSGVATMTALSAGQKTTLLEAMDELEDSIDYLLIDTAAGISESVLYFNIAAQERIVILTSEPTSLTDAYALVKVLQQTHGINTFKVLVNMVPDERVAKEMFARLYKACDSFLHGVSLDYVGMVPRDTFVRESVIRQKPFTVANSNSPASVAVEKLALAITSWETHKEADGNIKFFWKRLLFYGQEQ